MTILKDLYTTIYTIYACNPNKCYYLIKYKGRLAWQAIDKFDDCRNLFCIIKNKNNMIEMSNILLDLTSRLKSSWTDIDGHIITIPKIPKDATYIQLVESRPTIEDGKMWTENIDWVDIEVME